eukprot:3804569-Rhodomonas_salina.1
MQGSTWKVRCCERGRGALCSELAMWAPSTRNAHSAHAMHLACLAFRSGTAHAASAPTSRRWHLT